MAKKRIKKQKKRSMFPYFLIAIGLLLLAIWGTHTFLYNQSIALSDAIIAKYERNEPTANIPNFITVSTVARLKVVEAIKTQNRWPISSTAANHVYASAYPGQAGNIIIYGHNTDAVFGPLHMAQVADTITIVTINGKTYTYSISEIRTVATNETELLAPTTHEVLTIYTCTGFLDSMRLVIRALPVVAKE